MVTVDMDKFSSSSKHIRVAFIDGLRGYGALGVFLIHIGGLVFRPIHPYFNWLVDMGKEGVVVFFFISAFSICLSIDKIKHFDYKAYLIKRYLRLAPLYYSILGAAVIIFFAVNRTWYVKNIVDIFTHVTFSNFDFINHAAQTSVLGVEWTMPIIFWFYVLIPLLYFLGKWNIIALMLATIGGAAIYFYEYAAIWKWYAFNPIFRERGSPLNYLFTYLFAVTIFWLYKKRNIFKEVGGKSLVCVLTFMGILLLIIHNSSVFQIKLVGLILGSFLYLFFMKPKLMSRRSVQIGKILFIFESIGLMGIFFYYMVNRYIDHVPMVTLYLGLFTYSNLLYTPKIIAILFENRIIRFIGSISYAFYLVHLMVASYYDRWTNGVFQQIYIRFILILMITIGVSYLFTRYSTIRRKEVIRK
jgi:peptidoglycan/LPS O-acetylase OafA/YrhL